MGQPFFMFFLLGYCNTGVNTNSFANTTWNTDRELCGDLIVHSGSLTISACVTMPLNSKIEVRSGASLIFSGSNVNIANANLVCKDGSFTEIKNGAILKKNSFDQIILEDGAKLEYRFGDIVDLTQ